MVYKGLRIWRSWVENLISQPNMWIKNHENSNFSGQTKFTIVGTKVWILIEIYE